MWATGGLWFVWRTARFDYVSDGYLWLGGLVWGALAALSGALGFVGDGAVIRDVAGFALVALAVSALVCLKLAGATDSPAPDQPPSNLPATPRRLLLSATVAGLVGLVAAGFDAASQLDQPETLMVARILVGGLFLGAVASTMLLGHWYLVQPGMPRQPLLELITWAGGLWLADTAVWLLPTGMISVLSGSAQTSGNTLMGWFWLVCVLATAALLATTRLSLAEPRYQAVMAATGLSYLAIMTAFAMELVARAGLFG